VGKSWAAVADLRGMAVFRTRKVAGLDVQRVISMQLFPWKFLLLELLRNFSFYFTDGFYHMIIRHVYNNPSSQIGKKERERELLRRRPEGYLYANEGNQRVSKRFFILFFLYFLGSKINGYIEQHLFAKSRTYAALVSLM
jgi:hypothetical protein